VEMKAVCTTMLAALLTATSAFAPAPALGHDWYTGLKTPNGVSCCNQGDCRPVGHRYSPEGGHEVDLEGLWVHVDPQVILPIASPDGQTHACFSRYWWTDPPTKIYVNLRCVILGGES
jgi:hypothetical protein